MGNVGERRTDAARRRQLRDQRSCLAYDRVHQELNVRESHRGGLGE
jgi:hypothetical protein